MAKTTSEKKAVGKSVTEPAPTRAAAKSAVSAGKSPAPSASAAAKKRAVAETAKAAPAARTAAKPAAKRGGTKQAVPEQDEALASQASTVKAANSDSPRVDLAATANSMTKKLNEVPVDDANATDAPPAVAAAPAKGGEKAKARDRRAKEKALLKEAFATSQPGTAEELEERRAKLRALIKLGKERGFLTYAEINDHLPDNFTETEALEGIIGTFNDMGVAVYEQAPDAETLLLNDNAPAA